MWTGMPDVYTTALDDFTAVETGTATMLCLHCMVLEFRGGVGG